MMTLQTDLPVLQAQHQLAAAQIRAAEAVTQIGLHRIDREKRATHGFAAKQDSLAGDCNGNVPRTGAPVDGAAVRNKRELRVFIIFKCCGYCLECFPVLLMMASLMLHGIMQQFIGGFHPGVGAVHWEKGGGDCCGLSVIDAEPRDDQSNAEPAAKQEENLGRFGVVFEKGGT